MEVDRAKLQEADNLAEINQRIGQDLGILQVLEDISAYFFVLSVRASKGMGSPEGYALLEKARKETFGSTLTSMRKAKLLDEELQDQFEHIRRERNWLVHKSLNHRYQAMADHSALLKLMDRLNSIVRAANALMNHLADEAERYVRESGIDPSECAVEADRVRDSWASPDAQ